MTRNRTLTQVNAKLLEGSTILQDSLEERLAAGGPARVLELGFGEGRALLEFAFAFRDRPVEFHGIDGGVQGPVYLREDLRAIAAEYGIGTPEERASFSLPIPEIHTFGLCRNPDGSDPGALRHPDESFDLIYSAVVIRFLQDKVALLEEVCRVLRPGGVALLHVSGPDWEYAAGPVEGDRVLTLGASRLVLHRHGHLVPIADYLDLFGEGPFRFSLINRPYCVIRVDKLASGRLDLGLEFDAARTFPFKEHPYRLPDGRPDGGTRSAYRVSAEHWSRLAGRGAAGS